MTSFDPDRFEEKYTHYFTELQQAHRNAFDRMQTEADSDLVHAIDQLVLADSDPAYTGGGQFVVEVPENAVARVQQVLETDNRTIAETLDRYREVLAEELTAVFELSEKTTQ